jgi:streptogramin lyase
VRRIAGIAATVALAACTGSPGGTVSAGPASDATPTVAGDAASPAPSLGAPPDVRTATIDVGGSPWGIAYGFDAVWAPVGDRVVEIDVRRDDVESEVALGRSITAGSTTPGDPAAYDTAAIGVTGVWVTVPRERLTVVHIDPKYQRVLAVIPIGEGPGRAVPVAVDANGVWVPSAEGDLVRIDPRTDAVVERFGLPRGVEASGLAVAGGAVWIADASSGDLLRLDPESGAVLDTLAARATGPIGVDGSTLWVPGDGQVVSVNASNGRITARRETCAGARSVAPGYGIVWVAAVRGVCAIDGAGASSGPIAIDGAGVATAYATSAWVSVPSSGTVVRVDAL